MVRQLWEANKQFTQPFIVAEAMFVTIAYAYFSFVAVIILPRNPNCAKPGCVHIFIFRGRFVMRIKIFASVLPMGNKSPQKRGCEKLRLPPAHDSALHTPTTQVTMRMSHICVCCVFLHACTRDSTTHMSPTLNLKRHLRLPLTGFINPKNTTRSHVDSAAVVVASLICR